MKKFSWMYLLFIACLCTMGCEDSLGTYQFTFDADGKCYLVGMTSISQNEFEEQVQGYGWRTIATHKIHLDGTYDKNDYYHPNDDFLAGASPSTYYFGENHIKEYFPYDVKPVLAYALCPYEIQDPTDYFPLPTGDEMLIIEVKGTEMHAIVGPGNKTLLPGYDKRDNYFYLRLERMTAEEIAAKDEKYNYHWEYEKELGQ